MAKARSAVLIPTQYIVVKKLRGAWYQSEYSEELINAGYLRVSQPAGIRRIFIKGESILAMLDETMIERRA